MAQFWKNPFGLATKENKKFRAKQAVSGVGFGEQLF